MNQAADTLSDEIEPYLLREQYVIRSPRGRIAMPRAYKVLGKAQPRPKEDTGGTLFD
jgi:Holliday junction DNA helicase RuvB